MHLLCVCSIFRDSLAPRDWLVILTEASTYGVLVLVISLTLYPLQLFDTHGSSQWGLILVFTNYKRIFTPLYLSLLSVCFIFCYNSLLCLCVFLFIVSPFRTLEVVSECICYLILSVGQIRPVRHHQKFALSEII